MSSDTEEAVWTKENIQRLLAAIKTGIPERDSRSAYTKAVGSINWFQVAFPPYSPRACQEKWAEIFKKIRKSRTLTEIINDAEDGLTDPNRIQPALPQKPGRPSVIFYEENWVMCHEKNPKMPSKKLVRVLARKYKELPDEEKARYVEKHQLATEKYERLIDPKRKRDTSKDTLNHEELAEEGLPPRPPAHGYQLFCQEQVRTMGTIKGTDSVSRWAQQWRNMTETLKKEYNQRCAELRKQYVAKLDEYAKTVDEGKKQRILNARNRIAKAVTRDERVAEKLPGEPKMPLSAHQIFCSEQMKLLKEKFPLSYVRLAEAYKLWRRLSEKKKTPYRLQARQNMIKYSIELQKWFKNLTPAQQQEYRKRNCKKRTHADVEGLDVNVNAVESSHRPSDSEDEDIEDSSSDEEETVKSAPWPDFQEDEEEEEEEEDGDIAFDMF